MEIIINQAILHVLDTTQDSPALSGGIMELTAEKNAYLQNHLEKLMASDDIRACRFLESSSFKLEMETNHDFIDFSCRVAGVMFDYMHAHVSIPCADLAIVDFSFEGRPWLGLLKLNYKNGYTHYAEGENGALINSIVQQRTCLPAQSGKVDEGALVDLENGSIRLLEKKYDIDGKKDFYFSSVVLQCTQQPPEKKKLEVIRQAATQAVQDAYIDEPHPEAQVAMLIRNQAVDNKLSVEAVKRQIQEEYPLAAVPFEMAIEDAHVNVAEPVTVSPARVRRMESRSIRTQSGIEVKIPANVISSASAVEFLHDDDGTVSLLIKGVIM